MVTKACLIIGLHQYLIANIQGLNNIRNALDQYYTIEFLCNNEIESLVCTAFRKKLTNLLELPEN